MVPANSVLEQLSGVVARVLIAIWVLAGVLCVSARAGESAANVQAQIARLAAQVQAAEDVRAVKKLQRAYGYYVDKGMWEDVAALFTDDALANYPAGIFIGRESIRRHLYENVGGGKLGEVGLGDGRLYNHMSLQPVIHLDSRTQTAKGRWRVLAMIGKYGGNALWAEGVYEMIYRKEGGQWKIHSLSYYSGFGAPYETGWVPPERPRTEAGRRALAHPPDAERKMECEGFPAACIAPFHYKNPGTSADAHAWDIPEQPAREAGTSSAPRGRLADLAVRLDRLEDEQAIVNLQRIYGYYVDRAQWDQVADLFAADGSLEVGLQGVYAGQRRIRKFLDTLGPQGLSAGVLNDHIQLQTLVDVAPDGKTAYCRSRELAMTGVYGQSGTWSEGTFENTYVKEQGGWKFKSLHFYPTMSTDYDQGWGKSAFPAPGPNTTLPPDRPPTEIYGVYPKAYVPPYHYRNPATLQAPQYPPADRGGPDPQRAAVALMPSERKPPRPSSSVKNMDATLATLQRRLDRVEAYEELENLESAYGYYLDKNLWNDLADLFARDGSIELAQRGVYRGQDHVRAFLLKVFGRGAEGPVAGRLGNHLQLQPVIDVAADGRSARIRSRMLQQTSFGGRASLGGAVYENEAVKEEGVWRFKTVHAYNTFSASYQGGWAKGASRAMPGPSTEVPPDAPPTMAFAMFPAVYDIPFHYPNPVTGRTEVAPVSASTDSRGMPPAIAAALREIGPKIDPPRTAALYAPLQPTEPYSGATVTRDIHYGPDERQVLDLFTAGTPVGAHPIVVFIPGGGFTRGAKHTPGSPFYDNVGLWALRHGLVGITINYRLAPQFQWPAGIEDLTLLTGWLKAHVAQYGGDPVRIYLWGHSAGAAHVADYLAHAARTGEDPDIAGAILTSGFYDLGDRVSIWKDYYGSDVSQYAARSSLPGLLKTPTPLLVTYAELDPESFQSETRALIEARARVGKPVATVFLPGHSHISETYAVGTGDESLSGPVLDFIRGAGHDPGAAGKGGF